MVRLGERTSGKWKAISWGEAVSQVSANLLKIREKYGAESLAWFSEDHSFTHIQQDLCKMYGTPNYHNHANLCDVARKASHKLVMGNERPLADFEETAERFLAEHLRKWVPAFSRDLEAAAETDLYRELARATRTAVALD